MRVSVVAPLALAIAPAVVSAAGTMGFALGSKLSNGKCKSVKDYEDDLDAIFKNSGSKMVRGYSASECDCAKNLLPAAKSKGFKVVLGIWPDVEDALKKDIGALEAVDGQYTDSIYAVTVGSEALYRKTMKPSALKSAIELVRDKLPKGVKIGTADTWNKFYDGTANEIIPSLDAVFVNAFAYWQSNKMPNTTFSFFSDMYLAGEAIQKAANGKEIEIWNGETGWPTKEGVDYEDSKGGLKNAQQYYKESFCSYIKWGYNAFYFEAFDEPWKPDSKGDNGESKDEKHWGAMDAERVKKFDLHC